MVFRSGVGKREITPPVGTPLAGRPRTFPSSGVHDPLWVKAVYLEEGSTVALLASVDLILLGGAFTERVREAVSLKLGASHQAVILCATHTHTGPAVGWSPWEGQSAYEEELSRKILEAALDARAAAVPASLAYGEARREDLSHNRRMVMRNGRVVTHPGPDEDAVCADGPIDPRIQALQIGDTRGVPLAVLVGFACHATTMGWKEGTISADYPFWIGREIAEAFGEGVETLFFAGAMGDIGEGGDWLSRSDSLGSGLAGRIGGEIGREAIRALRTGAVEVSPRMVLDYAEVGLPAVDMGPGRREWAEGVLSAPDGRHGWEVRDARMVLEMWPTWPDEVLAGCPLIALGDVAFYGVPGELFCWYGLQLRARSPFRHPFILGLANDRVGYIADRVFPTKDVFDLPLDFATREFGRSGDAGERLVRTAIGLGPNPAAENRRG